MDRSYAEPLDVPTLATIAGVSEAHFIRVFKETFGETPHRYLQRRRVERAMYLLRDSASSVTDVCFDVGFNSLGTFSRTFTEIVGVTPSTYRQRASPVLAPTCFTMSWSRPSTQLPRPVELHPGLAGPGPADSGLAGRPVALSEKRDEEAADYHAPSSPNDHTRRGEAERNDS